MFSEDITDVEEYLRDGRFLECRSEGHAWQRQHIGWVVTDTSSGTVLTRTSHCRNPCGMIRIRRKTLGGIRLPNVYTDTQGYHLHGVRLTRDEVDEFEMAREDELTPKRRKRKAA